MIGVTSVTSLPENQTVESTSVADAGVSLLVPFVSNVAATVIEEPAVITMGALQSTTATGQPGLFGMGIATGAAPTEAVPTASILPGPVRSADFECLAEPGGSGDKQTGSYPGDGDDKRQDSDQCVG